MRKLIAFSAGVWAGTLVILLVVSIVTDVVLLKSPDHAADSAYVWHGRVAIDVVLALLALGYFPLMKKLGAWNEAAWYRMGKGRKTVLFLLAIPGMIEFIGPIILLAIFGFFAMVEADADQARRPLPWEKPRGHS